VEPPAAYAQMLQRASLYRAAGVARHLAFRCRCRDTPDLATATRRKRKDVALAEASALLSVTAAVGTMVPASFVSRPNTAFSCERRIDEGEREARAMGPPLVSCNALLGSSLFMRRHRQ
jgi:hypothetical protein